MIGISNVLVSFTITSETEPSPYKLEPGTNNTLNVPSLFKKSLFKSKVIVFLTAAVVTNV